MKSVVFLLIFFVTLLHTSQKLPDFLSNGELSAKIKYYYIETNKKFESHEVTSSHSHAVGMQINYITPQIYNIKLHSTLMTTQGFLLPKSVESSTLAQDNGRRGYNPTKSFGVIAEFNLNYEDDNVNVWYGRKVITTPMIGAKEVRMLPSSVYGTSSTFFVNDTTAVTLSYIESFKQRPSNDFINIVKHALGEDTQSIIGKDEQSVVLVDILHVDDIYTLHLNNLYSENFINSAYLELRYKNDFYTLEGQVVSQKSIGNADKNLDKVDSVTKGNKINSNAIGIRSIYTYKESSIDIGGCQPSCPS